MSEADEVLTSGVSEAAIAQLLEQDQLPQDSYSSSEGDSSDPGVPTAPPIIRQTPNSSITRSSSRKMEGSLVGNQDDKLFLTGNLVGSSINGTGSEDQFTEEGIYQGLVMTDKQKKNVGILPESMYMTNNLIEKKDLIESLSLDSIPATAVEVPEVPFPPTSPPIFSKETLIITDTIPKIPPPKPPTREKGRDKGREKGREKGRDKDLPSHNGPTLVSVRSLNPCYRDLILRPPALPPLETGANRAEKKAHAVVENLVKSEAAYLTSLNIAIKVYKSPLLDMAEGPVAILSVEEVETIFGPISQIFEFQEIFYCAVTTRTVEWTSKQKIGDVLSSLSIKDVIQNYSGYVNNFTVAMSTLEKAINKKPKFVRFLKEKYAISRTSLSLQGLLLKPIQRFPQYIMFLQELIRFTSTDHPDRVTLLMALARYEGIANFLNERKRQQEQIAVVQNLTHKVSHLPFRLTDAKRWLHRQDIVSRLMISSGGDPVAKDRCLLLFNNMVLCAAVKRRKRKGMSNKPRADELESSTGSRDFQCIDDFFYTCKWYCPLEDMDLVQPDYINDIWDKTSAAELDSDYKELKGRYKELERDFLKVSRIVSIAATLHADYSGLTCSELSNQVRILQRKIAKLKEDLKVQQEGRMDIVLPSRENDKKVHHTYTFKSERAKLDWINNLRYSKRKLKHPVSDSWVIAEDVSQGDIFEVSYKLPLFVENCTLNMIDNELLSVQCSAKVGLRYAWLASSDNQSAQVSVVECVMPSPLILECFKVSCKRIVDMVFVPPSSFCFPADSSTILRKSRTQRRLSTGTLLTQLPPYLPSVWMGTQCGKVIIYNADSAGDDTKQCLATVRLRDTVTNLQYYKDQVFVLTVEGDIVIFKRSVSGFNLISYSTVHVVPGLSLAIRCSCLVGNKLWVGIGPSCYFFNMQTHRVEGDLKMHSVEGVSVNRMVCQGEGVWVSYKGSSSLELFHTISKTSLQNIDTRATISAIITRRKLESCLPQPKYMHVTSIMASRGYLWIGTSVGAIMLYHIPHLDCVPIISGKPYLAMDGHVSAVRVLLTMETMADYESSRHGKFLADEQFRSTQRKEILMSEAAELGESESHDQENVSPDLNTLRRRSASDPNLPVTREEAESKDRNFGDIAESGDGAEQVEPRKEVGFQRTSIYTDSSAMDGRHEREFEKSVTPFLPDPSTIFLEDQGVVEEPGEERSEVKDEGGASEDDYNTDEVESRRRFGGGVRALRTNGNIAGTLDSLPSEAMDLSMRDSGDYTIPIGDLAGHAQYGNVPPATAESPYNVPSELDTVNFEERRAALLQNESVYSIPHELEAGGLEAAANGRAEGDYDFPSALLNDKSSPSDVNAYEDPATLANDPSRPLSQFFSKMALKNSLSVPGRQALLKEGAIFVLTAGRGLVNFRSGKQASVFNRAHIQSEGCMMVYEIEV